MDQIVSANKFVAAMIEADGKLANVKAQIDAQRNHAQEIIRNFSDEQRNIINEAKNEIKSPGSESIFEEYRNVLTEAVSEHEKAYSEYIKGMEFIKKFEECFIVSVFGKVKCGKSYLGNYMMGNSFKKAGVKTEYDSLGPIQVTVYDKGKLSTAGVLSENIDESEGQGFGVASTEATSTIQYFKIGGLSWFDTPGIGSITKENEELAEEYIKNSDLVIFAMNSDAAGTQQEIAELKTLCEMNKPILLLITQSDTFDQDFDDDGNFIEMLCPKSAEDRRSVEKYILDTIKENGMTKALELSNNKVLTISTKLASEAIGKESCNNEMYRASNIDDFIQLLIDITHSEAASIKEQNPKDRFNRLISELLNSINSIDRQVGSINEAAEKIKNNATDVKKRVIEKVRYYSYDIIHEKVCSAVDKLNNDVISGNQIAEAVSDEINRIIQRECREGLKELIPDVGSQLNGNIMSSSSMNISDLSDKKISSSYEVEVLSRTKVSRGFFGPILDLIFGEKYRTSTSTETRTIELSVGNNSLDIEEQLISHFEQMCSTNLDRMISDITEGCIKPLETIYNRFVELTATTKAELEKLTIL